MASSIGEIVSAVLFYELLFSAINLAWLLKVVAANSIFSILGITCFLAAWSVSVPTALYCKMSENLTGNLEKIEDLFYDCSWYCLSVKHQQMFILPILRAQKEYRMIGLGLIECSLATFTSVGFHFYQLLRFFSYCN